MKIKAYFNNSANINKYCFVLWCYCVGPSVYEKLNDL